MPAEKRSADALDTTASKKRKMPASPLLKTSYRVLDLVERGEPLTETRVLQALCNAVISASVEKDGDNKDALTLLAELLAQDLVDPNAGDEAMWDIYGGSPLYQACALDLPDATRLLLNHGASVVQVYKDQTPLQVALGNKDSSCVKVIMEHIGRLEKKAREGRDKDASRHGSHGSRCPAH
eukprot:g7961.t2